MQSIHQQLITFGLIPKFLYQGMERLSPSRAEEVHAWSVQLTGPTGAVLEDRYRATVNEFRAMRSKETTVTEQYILDFVQRMELVERTGTDGYEDWLDLKGVAFGVTIEDTQAGQEFWKARFANDVRCFKGLRLLLGSRDIVSGFLSGTMR